MECSLIPELKCDDYEQSLIFYRDMLGFDVMYVREDEGFAMLEYQGSQLMIDSLRHCSRFVTGMMEKPYGRGVSFQIRTADVDAIYKRAKDNSLQIFLPMETKWYGVPNKDIEVGNKQFLVQDPDGYLLRFYEDLGERQLEK